MGLLRAIIGGACGSATHASLMWVKARFDILPEFQPYNDLQRTLASTIKTVVPQSLLWTMAFLNGAVVLSFIFHRTYSILPGHSWVAKGLVFGIIAWVFMGMVFFPLIGEGLFAFGVDQGALPALFSLVMLLVYASTLSAIYSGLHREPS